MANKGEKYGECNRTACKHENAIYEHLYTGDFYCKRCAMKINDACRDHYLIFNMQSVTREDIEKGNPI